LWLNTSNQIYNVDSLSARLPALVCSACCTQLLCRLGIQITLSQCKVHPFNPIPIPSCWQLSEPLNPSNTPAPPPLPFACVSIVQPYYRTGASRPHPRLAWLLALIRCTSMSEASMTGSCALSLQHEGLCRLADVCVWGAVCLGAKDDGSASGICTPIVKGTASSVQVRLVPPLITPLTAELASLLHTR